MTPKTLLALLLILLTSCSDDILSPKQDDVDIADNEIVLGKKLPNPYSLSVMQRAYDELSEKMTLKSTQKLQATHYYLRFEPCDTAEVDLLEADTTIFYYSYPMDYEIVQEGDVYNAPDLSEGAVKYMYCAVEVSHKLPDVPYTLLDELYILEETNAFVELTDEDDQEDEKWDGNKSVDTDYWEALEMRAKMIVGAELQCNKSRWRPQGDIYYQDNTINKIIPLEGVPVRCRKSIFVTHQCCTNENGHFAFGKLRGHVDYYISWRRDDFKIREHTGLSVAETNLKRNTKSSVTYTATKGSRAWEYASIFRGAHFYYYKAHDYGLSRPSKNSLTIRPSAMATSNNGSYNNHVFGSDVHIFCFEKGSAQVFCTTIHEVAHSVHQFWNPTKYHSCETKVKEAWSGGVAWFLSEKVYNPSIVTTCVHYKVGTKYTGLVKDLIDGNDSKSGYDKVTGFTIAQVETAFKKNTKWNSLKEYFKSLKVAKDEDIDELFDHWAGSADGSL